ncbi:TonB-dependent receptor [Asticcacaulis sp. EMRT-3]|uniref:TonB-dependent receptor n=1 Tax=Asticcacaulis sp. EMRT-3 TaxID=3040349 RepID=UPI0024AF48A1|nr:TonB-dependent receptor [Asticcacaulis sp. EMRT-3]MDI7775944.1 TonB-dependent receptor [Asticcacaulis sp. EMRT-3]
MKVLKPPAGQPSYRPGPELRLRLCVLLFCLLAVSAFFVTRALADGARLGYAIAARPLAQALLEISRTGGIVVVAPSDLVAGKTSHALTGTYTPQEALALVLTGTGLSARRVSASSFVLIPAARKIPVARKPQALDTARPTEVVVTASRDLATPRSGGILSRDTLSGEHLAFFGTGDLPQALTQAIPAIAMQAYGRDAANNTPSIRLRDLSPNDTLTLVNGKRRHGTSSLSVIAGPFQGGASADVRMIPVNLIDHVEVVTDELSAGYGSDAIAGVVNIVLKSHQGGGAVTTTTGGYFDSGGQTVDVAANMGVVSSPTAFLQVSLQSKYHGYSQRGAVDPRVLAYPGLTAAKNYPYLNTVFGDGAYRLNVFGFNAGRDLGDHWQVYGFGMVGLKTAASRENWRAPDRLPDLYPQGFTPHEAVRENDSDFTLGLRGQVRDWSVDAAFSHGADHQDISNYGSANISLYQDTGSTPTRFNIGDFARDQSVVNLDVHRAFQITPARRLSLAFGIEDRLENYAIGAGDYAATYKEGAQGFPGFSAQDAGHYRRRDEAAYIELGLDDGPLKITGGGRIVHVSGFGSALIGRMSAHLALTPVVAVRMALSNGWRAPTLAESYYSATNVSPSAAALQLPPSSAAVRALGLSPLVPETSRNASLGLSLHPARNLNISLSGYQIDIHNRIVGSGTLYGFGNPDGRNAPAILDAIAARGVVLDPGITKASLSVFTNGLDTRTRGLEMLANMAWAAQGWRVRMSLSGNASLTRVSHIRVTPASLQPQSLFDPFTLSNLEDASPAYRWILDTQIVRNPWMFDLRATLNGHAATTLESNPYTEGGVSYPAEWIRSVIHPHVVFDVEASYRLNARVSLYVGADNIFNLYPEKIDARLLHSYVASQSNLAVYQYATWSAFGINGGYYYTRLKVDF